MIVPSQTQSPRELAGCLITLLEDNSQGDYIGESISQLEHSLQCAHRAANAGSSEDVVIAALFHDIGQFLPLSLLKDAVEETDVGRPNHASTGSAYLASLGFPNKVTNIVAQHVAAKRYLTATDSAYMNELSDASKKSLKQQGGPMSEDERKEFEEMEGWRECLQVRKWDDQAKVVGVEDVTPRTRSYEDSVVRVLERARAKR